VFGFDGYTAALASSLSGFVTWLDMLSILACWLPSYTGYAG
jgi:hypothetical protein